jgi:hypothetical protein
MIVPFAVFAVFTPAITILGVQINESMDILQ